MNYSKDKYLTEYFEEELENFANDMHNDASSYGDDFPFFEELDSDVEYQDDEFFSEDEMMEEDTSYLEEDSFSEEEDSFLEEGDSFLENDIQHKDNGMHLPGAENSALDEEVDQEPAVETDWENDRDTSKFIDYLRNAWANVPKHDGNSISGCERAYIYLNKLSREISEAIRKDEGSLDPYIDEIEQYRVKILTGMQALSDRQKKLKKELMDKKADVKPGFNKEGTYPHLQVVITPFERAITGILINSVISAGHPFEDVYEYLKNKFELTPREELSILQTAVDMGFPIFKDRGLMGGDETDGTKDGQSLDFIKNYFA